MSYCAQWGFSEILSSTQSLKDPYQWRIYHLILEPSKEWEMTGLENWAPAVRYFDLKVSYVTFNHISLAGTSPMSMPHFKEAETCNFLYIQK